MKDAVTNRNITRMAVELLLAVLLVARVANAGTQTNDKGEVAADSGVNVEKGQAISFDEYGRMKSATAGYWRGVTNKTYTLTFTDEKGERALLECTGEITWDKQGKITKGEKGFLRIMTGARNREWYKIIATELKDGVLSITAETGTYTYFAKAKVDSASARPILKATITAGKVWNGQASFILSNFSPSFDDSGRIAMDLRNYEVSETKAQDAQPKDASDKQ